MPGTRPGMTVERQTQAKLWPLLAREPVAEHLDVAWVRRRCHCIPSCTSSTRVPHGSVM
jgi:hypothetical protein